MYLCYLFITVFLYMYNFFLSLFLSVSFLGVNSSIFWIFLDAYQFVGSNMRCDGNEIMCNVEN